MSTALRELHDTGRGWLLAFGALGLVAAGGLSAAAYMEHHGHIVTGMDNQIVWGLPHVFAVFLIVAASGALNVASMASVFGKTEVKPLAPLSGLLAMALLVGGLAVLMLDLGRPDRLIVAMTHYNFKSIFAWNVFLYTGFLAIVAAYLWTMLERRMNAHSAKVGLLAFVWRLALTTGTGSIFGFIVARQAFDSALLAPLFVTLSLAYGLAVFLLVLLAIFKGTGRPLGDALLQRLARLLAIFVAAGLYFVIVQHLTGLYFTKQHAFERFILVDGGVHTLLFWAGQVFVGGVLPLVLLLKATPTRSAIVAASALVVAGAFAQMYVTIIGGQAYPMPLFPGKTVVASSFFDGQIATYAPSLPEAALGVGGFALALALAAFALKVLPFLPQSLSDADADPHYKAA
ncbi:MAG TPA: NrfD/PsrC family molybdoenzyme membrane anchor subunit [Albitalea sp.]|nr:NrfD/PsrC family molybdoenzyme membrane anchor subunit [Albitalea sp.]